MSKKGNLIIEYDTGERWQCPCCRKWYILLHRQNERGRPTSHRLEEIYPPHTTGKEAVNPLCLGEICDVCESCEGATARRHELRNLENRERKEVRGDG